MLAKYNTLVLFSPLITFHPAPAPPNVFVFYSSFLSPGGILFGVFFSTLFFCVSQRCNSFFFFLQFRLFIMGTFRKDFFNLFPPSLSKFEGILFFSLFLLIVRSSVYMYVYSSCIESVEARARFQDFREMLHFVEVFSSRFLQVI